MHVIVTFEHNTNVEMAILELEQQGIPSNHIFAAALNQRKSSKKFIDTIHRADGVSTFDIACILGTTFMLLGSIYGYVLTWGPIIWGIIGAVSGLLTGFLLTLWKFKNKNTRMTPAPQVVMMIHCEEYQGNDVEALLWDLHAMGVTQVNKETSS